MSDPEFAPTRRNALKCLGFGGAGTLFALSGGVLAPIDLAMAASNTRHAAKIGTPLFVQISDSHIGFNKDANPDVKATLTKTIDLVNALPKQPAPPITYSVAQRPGSIADLQKSSMAPSAASGR